MVSSYIVILLSEFSRVVSNVALEAKSDHRVKPGIIYWDISMTISATEQECDRSQEFENRNCELAELKTLTLK